MIGQKLQYNNNLTESIVLDRNSGVDGAKGLWMQTYTNGKFFGEPQCFHLNEYNIEDIAESLSKKVRWGGHCKGFYTVAQHCVHVCDILPDIYKLEGLLHDMSETFLGDIPRPIKAAVKDARPYEDTLFSSMAKQFQVLDPLPKEVHEADNILLVTEARDLMGDPEWTKSTPFKPLETPIDPWWIEKSKIEFLKRYDEYKRV